MPVQEGSVPFLVGGGDDRASARVIAFGNHQPPRDCTDAAFHEAGMLVEHEAVDAGIAQSGLRPGQADDIVRPKKLSHADRAALSGEVRPIAGSSFAALWYARLLSRVKPHVCSAECGAASQTGRRSWWGSYKVPIAAPRPRSRRSTRCSTCSPPILPGSTSLSYRACTVRW